MSSRQFPFPEQSLDHPVPKYLDHALPKYLDHTVPKYWRRRGGGLLNQILTNIDKDLMRFWHTNPVRCKKQWKDNVEHIFLALWFVFYDFLNICFFGRSLWFLFYILKHVSFAVHCGIFCIRVCKYRCQTFEHISLAVYFGSSLWCLSNSQTCLLCSSHW